MKFLRVIKYLLSLKKNNREEEQYNLEMEA